MAKIKRLPETVANQISAGEVVERPASVVKELVENAIDAESTIILIEVDDGGRERIRVKDNGKGIEEDDLELAFSRYATSKIEKINDLYSIKTLGFRGEALASIASVSRLEISSRSQDALKGNYLKLEAGKVLERKPVGVPPGTDITVYDLFFNTPARFKYLKTINTEFGHITNIVNREALAYPEIQFILKHNGKEVFKTPGTGKLLDTIFAIFDQELVDKLIPLNYEDRFIKLDGYLASPDYYRASRSYEYFFVNKRTVYNLILSQGIEEGYRGLLPPGKYPVVFLNLKLNQILVDVNVHPTKREIKFSRDEIIKDVVKKGVRQALEGKDLAPRFKLKSSRNNNERPDRGEDGLESGHQERENNVSPIVQKRFVFEPQNSTKKTDEFPDKTFEKVLPAKNVKIERVNEGKSVYNKDKENHGVKPLIDKQIIEQQIEQQSTEGVFGPVKRVLGQIKATYIVAEGIDGLYLIDQHNGHERVIYERIFTQYNQREIKSQSMIVPVAMEMTLPEIEIFQKYQEEFSNLGFKLEPFGGNSYLIQEIPVFLKNRPVKEIVRELIDTLMEGKTRKQAEIIENTIAYISCRSAIKAGSKMERAEMERLIKELFLTSNPYRCPHGRPILIHLTDQEIDRGLGRV